MRNLPVLALTLAVGLSVAACDIQAGNGGDFKIDFASGKATDTWSRSYKLAENGRFELINVNGKITAEPTDGDEVVVEGRRSAKARSDEAAKENLAKLEIREEVGGSAIRIESRPPRLSGFGGHEIEWTIKVPKGVILDLRTINGGIRLNDLSNEIHAKTTNGGVRGENITPSVIEASAVNGGVEFNLGSPLDGTDSVDLETVNGGVTLELPSESKATVAARCVNGGVHVDGLEMALEEQAGDLDKRRRLNGTLNGGGANVKMNTTNGGIRLNRANGSRTS